MDEMKYYTLDETAKILKVHRNTVIYNVKKGRMTGRKAGRLWRFSEEDIKSFIETYKAEEKKED